MAIASREVLYRHSGSRAGTNLLVELARRSAQQSAAVEATNRLAACRREQPPGRPRAATLDTGRYRVREGVCGATEAAQMSDCSNGVRGSWTLGGALEIETLADCVAACSCCDQCHVVSFSTEQRDCSWYSECPVLQPDSAFVTVTVGVDPRLPDPSANRSGSPGAESAESTRRHRGGKSRASTQAPLQLSSTALSVASEESRIGHCGMASAGADCARDDEGSWALSASDTVSAHAAAGACMRRCLGCSRCRYVSYSLTWADCSWFRHCDMSHLMQVRDLPTHHSSSHLLTTPTFSHHSRRSRCFPLFPATLWHAWVTCCSK